MTLSPPPQRMFHSKDGGAIHPPLFLINCHPEQGEALRTASGRNLVRAEVNRSKRAAQWGVRESVTQWVICRRQKRPERVNRSKKQVEAPAMPAAPTEIAEQSRRLRLRTNEVSAVEGSSLKFSVVPRRSGIILHSGFSPFPPLIKKTASIGSCFLLNSSFFIFHSTFLFDIASS